jgi:dTDP-4-amino-4,6-dideoxygalactose transaminase
MKVPLVDLPLQHAGIADEITAGFARVMEQGSYILGDEVAKFEEAFARFSGVMHCIGVANGTDALELGLRAVGIKPGDHVILPANSFAASALAVVRAGARPVFADINPDSFLIDVQDARKRLTPDCKAIMPVHLYGQLAEMEEIVDIARSAGLIVLEDAAQAQGASRNGVGIGGWSVAAGTSFYPAKNLGAYGDAGAVLTNSDEVARAIRSLRNYGSETKYHHARVGFNSRLDSLQAVVLNAKLKRLPEWNAARKAAAARYMALLGSATDVHLPRVLDGNDHVWHLFVVRVHNRDVVLQRLSKAGVGASVHYPVPLHLQPAFADLGYALGDFPGAERAAREVLSLPLYPEITEVQQQYVVETLLEAIG